MNTDVEEKVRKVEVKIEFKDLSKEQHQHLHNAEEELIKAGLHFDTGLDFAEHVRVWQFDWSLKGAKVVFVRFAKEE